MREKTKENLFETRMRIQESKRKNSPKEQEDFEPLKGTDNVKACYRKWHVAIY